MNPCTFKQCFDFDKRLQLPSNMLFVGATMSEKTSLFLSSLEKAVENYNPPPSKVFFMYQCFQESYLTIKQKLIGQGIEVEFSQASEMTEKELQAVSESTKGQILIAIDDSTIASSKSKNLAHLFTASRHYRCSIVLFWHTLFLATPESRIISQNTAYYFLLNSPRMAHQVANLGMQLNMRKVLVAAYSEATQKPYGYVMIDLNVVTPGFLRLRTSVFDKKIQYVYVPALK